MQTPEREPVVGRRERIIDGTVATARDYPSVVALRIAGASDTLCSGTLVAPDIVLAAAHCVDELETRSPPGAPAELEAWMGTGATDPALERVAVLRSCRAPAYDPVTHTHDVALFALASPASPAPAAIADALPATFVGTTVVLVGYGPVPPESGESLRRFGTATVSAMDELSFTASAAPAQGCIGDSGGPAMLDGRVAGVIAGGPADCSSYTRLRRVDVERELLDRIAADDPCPVPQSDDGCGVRGLRRAKGEPSSVAPLALFAVCIVAMRRRRAR